MPTRRQMLKGSMALTGATIAAGAGLAGLATQRSTDRNSWRMPDEGDPHAATWMAFGPSADVWGNRLLPVVRRNLADIANAIVAHEPVKMLVREEDHDIAERLCEDEVELIVCPIDDLWIRDTGPVFVRQGRGRIGAVDFNFNGWGGKQEHADDAEVAGFVARRAGVQSIATDLVLEGGGIEVDGQGTAIVTESCVLNSNRNPGVGKAACEAELRRLLGIEKVIWLPGIAGHDITDGHTDFYARFARPGVVVAALDTDPDSFDHAVTIRHREILQKATDARGRRLKVATLTAPEEVRPAYESDEFAAGYINFYVCNGAVIAPEFGDRVADAKARDTLRGLFPGRSIIQINIDGLAAGGGGGQTHF